MTHLPPDRPIRVAGIGELVADQIFLRHDGVAKYFGTRGGGSVWNTLSHLARAGFATYACATAGNDSAGHIALMDLQQSGVDTANVRLIDGKHTRMFTHYVSGDNKRDDSYPHNAFSTICPVCGSNIDRSQLTSYCHEDFFDALNEVGFNILCTDHLNAETAITAALFHNTITVLDLDNYRDLTRITLNTFTKWYRAFRIIFMPQQFASMLEREFSFDFSVEALQGKIELLILGKGKDGVEIHGWAETGKRVILKFSAPPVPEVVDTAGAGDALLASVLGSMAGDIGFHRHGNRLFVDPERQADLARAIHQAVTPVLMGIGARATLPKPGITGGPLATWNYLRDKPVDEIKEMNGGHHPCVMCGM